MAVTVDVISDLICPWCYIGKRRLERAIAALPPGTEVRVRWHAYQLNPEMPREGMDRRTYRTTKFGSWERSQQLDAQVTAAAAEEGLPFDLAKAARTPNTFDGHRVVWLAGLAGCQDAVVEALFQAYFVDGRDVGDAATLIEIATAAGLDRERVTTLLAGEGGTTEVREEEEQARQIGVQGVPLFVFDGRFAVSGAHDPATFLKVFEQAGIPRAAAGDSCAIDADGRAAC